MKTIDHRIERINRLLSDALGYSVDVRKASKRTKKERLEHELLALERRYIQIVSNGRTAGAGAGGFNRDIENVRHLISLKQDELKGCNAHSNVSVK